VGMSNRRPIAALLAALLCTTGLAVAPFHAHAAGVESKEAELQRVRSRIESVRKAIHAEAQRRDALAGQLKAADLKIQSARARLAEVRERRMASQAKLRDLESERADTQRKIDAQRATLAAEMKVAYMNG